MLCSPESIVKATDLTFYQKQKPLNQLQRMTYFNENYHIFLHF
jgi:hypothetical protein